MKHPHPKYKTTNIPWWSTTPEHWNERKCKYIFRRSKKIIGDDSANFPVLSLTLNGVIKRDLDNPMGKMPVSFNGYQIVDKNTLLFCLFDYDVTPRTVGLVNVNGIVSPAYTSIYPITEIDIKYYYYLFLMLDERKILLTNVTNLRNSVSYETFTSFTLPLPPLAEQTAIANYLDAKTQLIDSFISKKQKLIELLKEQKQNIINRVLQKQNKTWQKRKLKFCVSNISEQTTEMKKNEIYLGMENIESWTGRFIESEQKDFESQAKRFLPNDVLFGKLRPYLAKVFKSEINGVCSGEFLVLRPQNILSPDFLQIVLLNPEFIEQVNSSTFGSKMPRADWGFIGNLPIYIPTLTEQEEIVQKVNIESNRIESIISRIEKEIDLIKEYKQSLIAEAVTGKMRVN